MTKALDGIFIGKCGGGCTSGIDATDADALDTLFSVHCFPLVVDRARLKDSKEAWIHVQLTRVDETSDDRFHPLVEFSGAGAVLIFENSDGRRASLQKKPADKRKPFPRRTLQSTRSAAEAAQAIGCEVARIVQLLVLRGRTAGQPILVWDGPTRNGPSLLTHRYSV